jgi:ZIP family zinc transporter
LFKGSFDDTFALMDSNVQIALLFSTLAGLSTGIGGAVVYFSKLKNTSFLSLSMAFSAGVMIYVSFVEMLPHSFDELSNVYGGTKGNIFAVGLFFSGMLLVYLIDKLIPSPEHAPIANEEESNMDLALVKDRKGLFKTGVLVAVAIGIHNFPEGIATFVSSMNDLSKGAIIAFAIAMHNIPEGIAVATPIYYSTGSKRKAFLYALLSGLAEPLGAILTFYFLGDVIGDKFFGFIMAFIAGIMIYISIDFLLPSSVKYGNNKLMTRGIVAGMFVMAVSLLFE